MPGYGAVGVRWLLLLERRLLRAKPGGEALLWKARNEAANE